MEQISLKELPKEAKILLLKELGLGVDDRQVYVVGSDRQQVKDRYTGKPIRLDNMVILPGSTIVLDDNAVSLTKYMDEFGDVE